MTTKRKAAANRRNALASTGPRTKEGKAVSRWNALKHGLTASLVLIPGEEPDELVKFTSAMRAQLAPAGPLEELLVDRVVSLAWRLRRAAAVDAGLFARALFSVARERSERARARRRAELEAEWEDLVRAQRELERSWRTTAKSDGTEWWGPPDDGTWTEEKDAQWRSNADRMGKLEAERVRNNWRTGSYEAERLAREGRAEALPEPLEDSGNAALAAAFVTEAGVGAALFERLARYESALARELSRALRELERLQRERSEVASFRRL